jgi:transcription elongation factor GreA
MAGRRSGADSGNGRQSTKERDVMHTAVITQEGLARLSDELERLQTDGRRAIAERLAHATSSQVNLAENGDYAHVREEQAFLERRIAMLEARLRNATLVEPQPGNGVVDVAERVRLRDLESGERIEVELVGPFESDAAAGRISIASPLGRAVVGLRRGDVAEVEAPRGTLRFEILAVELATAGSGRGGSRSA